MTFVLVPAGEFRMGSPTSEPGHRSDERLHTVRISRPFYLGVHEVSQHEWEVVMGPHVSAFPGSNRPVEQINFFDALEFTRRLSRMTGRMFRLPTEAEWEYACRAGTTTAYAFGPALSTRDANYDGRYPAPGQVRGEFRGATAAASSFRPNAWGLYDMHGNVWEWCADDYCAFLPAERADPIGRCESGYKVIRGGSWYFGADSARSAVRYRHRPQDRGFSLGLRIVREVRP
jgi:formylglycine-generating enzyme required for sulfatase activity